MARMIKQCRQESGRERNAAGLRIWSRIRTIMHLCCNTFLHLMLPNTVEHIITPRTSARLPQHLYQQAASENLIQRATFQKMHYAIFTYCRHLHSQLGDVVGGSSADIADCDTDMEENMSFVFV